ncbi:hypothetical protein JCM10212_005524 [Sporobolomyces blumeae]
MSDQPASLERLFEAVRAESSRHQVEAERTVNDLKQQLADATQTLERSKSEAYELQQRAVEEQQKREAAEDRLRQLEEARRNERLDDQESKGKAAAHERETKELMEMLEREQRERQSVEESLTSLRALHSSLQASHDELEANLASQTSSSRTRIQTLQSSVTSLEAAKAFLTTELERGRAEWSAYRREKHAEVSRLQSELDSKSSTLSSQPAVDTRALEEHRNTQAELDALRAAHDQLRARHDANVSELARVHEEHRSNEAKSGAEIARLQQLVSSLQQREADRQKELADRERETALVADRIPNAAQENDSGRTSRASQVGERPGSLAVQIPQGRATPDHVNGNREAVDFVPGQPKSLATETFALSPVSSERFRLWHEPYEPREAAIDEDRQAVPEPQNAVIRQDHAIPQSPSVYASPPVPRPASVQESPREHLNSNGAPGGFSQQQGQYGASPQIEQQQHQQLQQQVQPQQWSPRQPNSGYHGSPPPQGRPYGSPVPGQNFSPTSTSGPSFNGTTGPPATTPLQTSQASRPQSTLPSPQSQRSLSSRPQGDAAAVNGSAPPTIAGEPLHDMDRAISLLKSSKFYAEGFLMKKVEVGPDGKNPSHPAETVWAKWFIQLSGTIMSTWNAAEMEEAAKNNTTVPPQYLNLQDAFLHPFPPHPRGPKPPTQFQFALNSAGMNRILFCAPNLQSLTMWINAIRLSIWERSRCNEIYTGSLIGLREPKPIGWPGYDAGLATPSSPNHRTSSGAPKFEGFLKARLPGDTEWRRVFVTVLRGANVPARNGASSASSFQEEKKTRRSSLLMSFGKKKKDDDNITIEDLPGDGQVSTIAFFPAGSGDTRPSDKDQPICIAQHVFYASALFPETAALINHSTLFKLEGTFLTPQDGYRTGWGVGGRAEKQGFALLMLESGEVDDMLRWIVGTADAFKLYGRSKNFSFDPRDPSSLYFALPIGPHRDRQFLDRELVDGLDINESRPRAIRAVFHNLLFDRMRGVRSAVGPASPSVANSIPEEDVATSPGPR